MKRILDRFDNSPLWIRLVTVLTLSFILVAGLYTVKKNTAAQVTTEIQPAKKTGSLPVKKETKEEIERKIIDIADQFRKLYGVEEESQ